MPRVCFTANIQRHVSCPEVTVAGETVHDVLDNVFAQNPMARGYVLNEQGELRRHMTIFVNGEMIADRVRLTDEVPDDAEVYVMQALSGG